MTAQILKEQAIQNASSDIQKLIDALGVVRCQMDHAEAIQIVESAITELIQNRTEVITTMLIK